MYDTHKMNELSGGLVFASLITEANNLGVIKVDLMGSKIKAVELSKF
jgi:hypothetical protein